MLRNPLLILTLLIVVGLAIAGTFMLTSGRDEVPEEEVAQALAPDDAAPAISVQRGPQLPDPAPVQSEPVAPQPAVASGDVPADIAAWAEGLRAAGYEVVAAGAAGGGLAGLEIGAPGDYAWRWTGRDIAVDGAATDAITVTVAGDQTLTWPTENGVATISFTSDLTTARITRAADAVASVAVELAGVTLAAPAGENPITIGALSLTLGRAAGDGALPAGTTLAIAGGDLVLPAERNGPLGSTVDSFEAQLAFASGTPTLLADALGPWAASETMMVSDLRLSWGLLELTADGNLGLDAEGRPEGDLEADITELLPALDAINVIRGLGVDAMSGWIAALLEARADGDSAATRVSIEIADGEIRLIYGDVSVEPIVIGTVGPVALVP